MAQPDINFDYNNPESTDKDVLLDELLGVRVEILRSLARARVVYERVLKEGENLRLEENSEGITLKQKDNEEEMTGAINAINALKNRLVALDKMVAFVKQNELPELFNIVEK